MISHLCLCFCFPDALPKSPLPLAPIPSHPASQQRQFQFIPVSNHFKLTLLIHLTVVTKGLAQRKEKRKKGVDTAVSKLSVSCDCFELRNPTVAFLVFLSKLISFLPGKGKEPEDSFSAAFENLFDCSNQLSVHLQ